MLNVANKVRIEIIINLLFLPHRCSSKLFKNKSLKKSLCPPTSDELPRKQKFSYFMRMLH